jgi:hypothetical protein
MAVQCPFCKDEWSESALLGVGDEIAESGQCYCGAWWYEGMEDVEDD